MIVPSVLHPLSHEWSYERVLKLCHKIFQGNVRQEEIWTKYYSVYLGSVTTVLSVWHLNHYSEVNGVLHNPVVQCLRQIMHVRCMRYAKKLVLKLLEHQCSC